MKRRVTAVTFAFEIWATKDRFAHLNPVLEKRGQPHGETAMKLLVKNFTPALDMVMRVR